ncbi:MAG: hypothetical protein SOT13_02585 [Candidatus Aphodousia sp.]|nr:hypothetical protein [Sutterella sp.]MDY2899399.1 hypothetical protein [Candidatus Aphodousia sp.]
MAFRITEHSIIFLKQGLRCLCYIGLGHTAFQVAVIAQDPQVSDLWYYGLAVPGLYYLIPILVLVGFIAWAERRKN